MPKMRAGDPSADAGVDNAAIDDPYSEPQPPLEDPTDDLGFYALDESTDEINALYYGREGTGKTTDVAFMANVPGVSRILIVNAEAGTKAVALRKRGVDTSKIVMWPPKGQPITKERLDALHRRLLSDLLDDPQSWGGVIWDSITEIAGVLLVQATDRRQDNLRRLNRNFDEGTEAEDYGTLNDWMRKTLRKFRDLPCHFAATALERDDEKTNTVGPELTPGVAKAVLGMVDFVLYCRADVQVAGEAEEDHGSEFRALTRASSRFRAKDRFDVTPRALADPNFLRLYGYVSGDLDEASDVLQQGYNERQAERAEAKRLADEAKAAEKAEKDKARTARKAVAKS